MNVNNNNEINIESKTRSLLLITVPYDIFIRKRWNVIKKSNLTEEIQVSRRASEQGSYAKPLLVQALSSHLRVWSAKVSLSQLCK